MHAGGYGCGWGSKLPSAFLFLASSVSLPLLPWPSPTPISPSLSGACDASACSARICGCVCARARSIAWALEAAALRLTDSAHERPCVQSHGLASKKKNRTHLVVIIRNARVSPALSAMGGPAPPAPPSSPFPFIGSRPYVGVVLLVKLARGRRTLEALPTSSHASLAHSYPRATPAREYTVMLARSRMSCLTHC